MTNVWIRVSALELGNDGVWRCSSGGRRQIWSCAHNYELCFVNAEMKVKFWCHPFFYGIKAVLFYLPDVFCSIVQKALTQYLCWFNPPSFQSHFQFYGVHAGSRRAIPFTLANHSPAAARVTFDLAEHTDFSVNLPQPSASTYIRTQCCISHSYSILYGRGSQTYYSKV